MQETTFSFSHQATEAVGSKGVRAIPLALKVLLVLVICHLSTQIGFAHKFPPHYISPLWPTSAILFSVLVVAPVRHWWVYTLAAYATSVINDVREGFPVSAMLFITAGILEIFIAAVGVRRFAGGARAFDSRRSLIAYLAIAVVLAPSIAAFVAAFAGAAEDYWFFWRVWFLSEALAYLMLAPAILTWISAPGALLKNASPRRWVEACLIGCGLLAVSTGVFHWPAAGDEQFLALVYLPLPILLWAAVRFGPRGAASSLLLVACLSISGAVRGRGPFTAGSPAEHVLSLQMFLITASVPLMFLATLIEEGRQRTSALNESEARFRTMADTAPMMIWMADRDKRFSYFNQRWLEFTGRTMEQELGDGWTEGIHPEDRQRCRSTYNRAFDARTPFELEYRLRRRDGQHRWIIDHGVPRRGPDGAFAGYIGSCLDITERKRDELQLQEQRRELAHLSRVAILGELSGSLAHELNQPLTAILSNAQAAQRFLAQGARPNLHEVREILAEIVEDNQRAAEVIRRLRALFRKGDLVFERLDLASVLADVVKLLHSDAVLRHVDVVLDLDPNLPPVRGDKIQLQQVALNLLVNAFDALYAASSNHRRVVVAAQRWVGPDDPNLDPSLVGASLVHVCVRDNGSGLSGDLLNRMFEPFVTTKAAGMGMGLSISRSIIEAHGGSLGAENHPQGGAVVWFTLPIQKSGQLDQEAQQ